MKRKAHKLAKVYRNSTLGRLRAQRIAREKYHKPRVWLRLRKHSGDEESIADERDRKCREVLAWRRQGQTVSESEPVLQMSRTRPKRSQ